MESQIWPWRTHHELHWLCALSVWSCCCVSVLCGVTFICAVLSVSTEWRCGSSLNFSWSRFHRPVFKGFAALTLSGSLQLFVDSHVNHFDSFYIMDIKNKFQSQIRSSDPRSVCVFFFIELKVKVKQHIFHQLMKLYRKTHVKTASKSSAQRVTDKTSSVGKRAAGLSRDQLLTSGRGKSQRGRSLRGKKNLNNKSLNINNNRS